MQDLYAQVDAASRSDVPVLVTGETGAGKELVARAIHGAEPPRRGSVRAGQRRGASRDDAGKRAVRPRAGRVHRRRRGAGRQAGAPPPAGRSCWTRSRPSPRARRCSFSACWTTGSCSRWAAIGRARWTSGWSAPPTPTLSEEVRRGAIREDFYHRIMVLNIRVPSAARARGGHSASGLPVPSPQAADRNGVPVPAVPRGDARRDDGATPGRATCGSSKNAVERLLITARDGTRRKLHARTCTSTPSGCSPFPRARAAAGRDGKGGKDCDRIRAEGAPRGDQRHVPGPGDFPPRPVRANEEVRAGQARVPLEAASGQSRSVVDGKARHPGRDLPQPAHALGIADAGDDSSGRHFTK